MAAKTNPEAPKTEAPKAPKTITVVAVAHLSEDGERYAPGDTFETTPKRAAALGALVAPVEDPPAE